MREFGVINTNYWNWIVKHKVSDKSTILGAFLLTYEHCNSLGCFRCPPAYVAEDLQYPIDTVLKGYAELYQKGFLCYCEQSKVVFLPKYLKWNPIMNGNHGKGTLKIAKALPVYFTFYDKLIESLDKYSGNKMPSKDLAACIACLKQRGLDTVSKRYRNKDIDTDIDIDKDILLQFPLKDKTCFEITSEYHDQLKEFFPSLNIDPELKKMAAWLDSNPAKRKTQKGIKKFITSWLSKAADKIIDNNTTGHKDSNQLEIININNGNT